jgi:hypothetical protein
MRVSVGVRVKYTWKYDARGGRDGARRGEEGGKRKERSLDEGCRGSGGGGQIKMWVKVEF